ncbi:H+ symporter [Xylariales sp. AK1849]|nr:H+ symporter [Xylariales sp. AK1849]
MDMLPEPAAPISHSRTYGGNRAFHNFFNDFSHIQDPNLRRRLALSEIDKIPFGWYHVRAIVVAGMGIFLDSYDIFAINLITTFLGIVFWNGPPEDAKNGYGGNNGILPTPVSATLKASTSAGIVIGQLLFGWLADVFGRRRMYGVELGIIVVATLASTLVAPSHSMSFTGLMTFWRVVMGVGIGGDYPLSSVITSEFAPTRWRGAMMAAVFSMQGLGQLMAAVVALIVTTAFKDAYHGAPNVQACDYICQTAADRSWRIIVGVGAIPACFALYYRITIPETPRYTFEVARDVEKASADIKAYVASNSSGEVDEVQQARMKKVASPALNVPTASWPDLFAYFSKWKNGRVLIGTTMSWFFLDLAFYGLGLNNTIVLHAIGYASGDSMYQQLHNNAVGTIILTVAGSLPGYWTAIVTIDTLGRKPLQVFGFVFLTVIFCILGFSYNHLNQGAMLALYVIAQFFFNWGPNTTTFIVPGECYPTRYRSSGHGLSAAMGKIGAIIAQVISIPLLAKDSPANCQGSTCSPWLNRLMQIFALFMLCGTFVSLLIPETKGMTLEELSGEAPTSYNAGRNGSTVVPSKTWWNPFVGGQSAGFFHPWAVKGSALRGQRVGIMTSPELAAQQAREMKTMGRQWNVNRGGSQDSEHCDFGSTSSTAGIVAPGAARLVGGKEIRGYGGVFPGWGAGWGRVDPGGNPASAENISLQDVSNLLR